MFYKKTIYITWIFIGLLSASATLLTRFSLDPPRYFWSIDGFDYWLGTLTGLYVICNALFFLLRIIRKHSSPERVIGEKIEKVIFRPRKLLDRLITIFTNSPKYWIGFEWHIASRDELYLFEMWSESDENINETKIDRLNLYRKWYNAEPRAFAILTRDLKPIGGTILLPLSEGGVDHLSQDQISAINIRSGDILHSSKDILIDTMIADSYDRPSSIRRDYFMSLLKEHLLIFLPNLDEGRIWIEPDHPVFKVLTKSKYFTKRGSTPSDCGTWSIELKDIQGCIRENGL